MKFILFLLLFFSPLTIVEQISGKVIGILDGDTIEILCNNYSIRIRLNGIDCPEKSQDFGEKAKQFTSNSCLGKNVKIISFGEDRYGRMLGDVILPNGKVLNQELIKEGFAWHYKKYSSDTVLANLEVKAKKDRKGLWLQPNAIAPWEYRKQNMK